MYTPYTFSGVVRVSCCLLLWVHWHGSGASSEASSEPFPFYNINTSFEKNITHQIPNIEQLLPSQHDDTPQKKYECSLLGYPLRSPIGVAACALTTSKGIELASKLGFNILTYKTIRSRTQKAYPPPNVCTVACNRQLNQTDVLESFYATSDQPSITENIAISNSVGNASPDPKWVTKDIQRARSYVQDGQVLIVSVYGEGNTILSTAHDFAHTARKAQKYGAQIIELNLSCPNILNGVPLYKDYDVVETIIKTVYKNVSIPIIVKIGIMNDEQQMRTLLRTIAESGAQGICGINSVPAYIKNPTSDRPFFGPARAISGLSGDPIRSLARQFVATAARIKKEEQLDLTLLATGGITKKEHFEEFLKDADAALCATAFMHNPFFMTKQKASL